MLHYYFPTQLPLASYTPVTLVSGSQILAEWKAPRYKCTSMLHYYLPTQLSVTSYTPVTLVKLVFTKNPGRYAAPALRLCRAMVIASSRPLRQAYSAGGYAAPALPPATLDSRLAPSLPSQSPTTTSSNSRKGRLVTSCVLSLLLDPQLS